MKNFDIELFKEFLNYVDNRLDLLIKYFNALDDKYKIEILKDIRKEIKELKNGSEI